MKNAAIAAMPMIFPIGPVYTALPGFAQEVRLQVRRMP